MLRLLELLLRGHIHEWETIDEKRLVWSDDFGERKVHSLLRPLQEVRLDQENRL